MEKEEMKFTETEEAPIQSQVEAPMDPFTQFMFGGRRSKRENSVDERGDWFIQSKQSNQPFNLFQKENGGSSLSFQNQGKLAQIEEIINNLDYVDLMEKIDTFITATNQLKPLYRDVKSIFSQFLQKK
ncbi:hypothetical protein ACE38V_00770 [Cytobacillus sp. Hz8]|uniref:hypothetical protein n=1 Tax=Cytobacillus sp. Hz8 TaxID=3347168 RepID=UPI0035E3455A